LAITNYKLYRNGEWAGNHGIVFSYNQYFYSDQLNPPGTWNFKIVAENSAGDSAFSEEVGVVPPHLSGTWTDTAGEGNFGESCNEWLSRTGQLGKRTRVMGNGNPLEESKCAYVVNNGYIYNGYWVKSVSYYLNNIKDGNKYPVSSDVGYGGVIYSTQSLVGNGPSINIAKTGNGNGTVTGTGINCGLTCPSATTNYVTGDTYTLFANPAPGSWFGNSWSGACTGTEPCTLTMDESKSVEAHFDPVTLNVARTGIGDGVVTGPGINCGLDCFESELTGTITLTASSFSGSVFGGWLGDCSGYGTNPSCDLDMSSPKSVTAVFDPETAALQVTKTGDGTGTVTSNPTGINCGSDCTEDYSTGTIVTLTASPSGDSEFAGWTGSCAGTSQCILNMDAPKTATATFNKKNFQATTTPGGIEEVRP